MASENVLLLHGIFRTRFSMRHVERALVKQGYRVLNITYPSTRMDIAALAKHIHPQIEAFIDPEQPVHCVGYSMGGLILRHYLHHYRPARMGRVVMMGTPNGGSEIADFLNRFRAYRLLGGPAGQQLITKQDAFRAIFGTIDYPLGVIAGSRSLDPICNRIIGKPNDGKVSIDSTRINGMSDHIVLPVDHFFMPRNAQVLAAVSRFLKHGTFAA